MSSGHGANKPDKANHPGRKAERAAFGIGDTIHVPGHGAITVNAMGKRFFSGTTATGEAFGRTSVGLARGEGMHGDASPWKIDRQ